MNRNTFNTHADTIVFLNQLNADLKEVVALAETDFIEVNTVLRDLYQRNQALPAGGTRAEAQSRLETIMIGLQYMDVLSQRIDHLVVTHEKMTSVFDFEKWFFHLHVFQSRAIKRDLLESITSIRSSMVSLNSPAIASNNGAYFSNTSRIDVALQKVISLLTNAGGELSVLPLPPLTEEQITALSAVYTMDNERIVLNWFQRAMPTGTWEDLLHHFDGKASAVETDNIELF